MLMPEDMRKKWSELELEMFLDWMATLSDQATESDKVSAYRVCDFKSRGKFFRLCGSTADFPGLFVFEIEVGSEGIGVGLNSDLNEILKSIDEDEDADSESADLTPPCDMILTLAATISAYDKQGQMS